jgi:hypothetical protein
MWPCPGWANAPIFICLFNYLVWLVERKFEQNDGHSDVVIAVAVWQYAMPEQAGLWDRGRPFLLGSKVECHCLAMADTNAEKAAVAFKRAIQLSAR